MTIAVPTLVGYSHKNNGGAATTLTTLSWDDVIASLALQKGDLAIVWCSEQNSTAAWTWPTGFLDITGPSANRTNLNMGCAVYRVKGTETGAIGTVSSTHSVYKSGGLLVVRDAAQIIAQSSRNGTAVTGIPQNSNLIALPGTLTVNAVSQQASGTAAAFTKTAAFDTKMADESSTTNPSTNLGVEILAVQAPTAASSNSAFTSSISSAYVAQQLIIASGEAMAMGLAA